MGRKKKIGLIAGAGQLPVEIAKELTNLDYEVHTLALQGFADPLLVNLGEFFTTFRLGKVKDMVDYLKHHKIKKVIIAGKVEHVNILKDIKPDAYALSLLKRMSFKDSSSVFKAIKSLLKEHSIEIVRYDTLLSSIIPDKKIFSGKIDRKINKNIEKGYKIAKEIAKLGIGQAIAINDGVIVAVEGLEGTDKMIERAGLYSKGFLIVKVAMENQDMRFDIPVVGFSTVKKIIDYGGSGLVIEANKTIVLDFDKVVEFCNENNLILVAK